MTHLISFSSYTSVQTVSRFLSKVNELKEHVKSQIGIEITDEEINIEVSTSDGNFQITLSYNTK